MNLAYLCLVLLPCICFARGQDMISSLVCDENGKLTATTSVSSFWTVPPTASCGDGDTTIQIRKTGHKLVIAKCPTGKDVVFTAIHRYCGTKGEIVTMVEQDEMSVTLRRDAIQSDISLTARLTGLSYLATHSVTPIKKNITETIAMVMQLRDNGSDVTIMNLGARYDLLIAGAENHDTTVKQCTATGSTDGTGVPVYPSGSLHVLANFTKDGVSSRDIDGKPVNQMGSLIGFRLVGFDTVYLKCTIIVCANSCDSRKRGKHPSNVGYATLKLNVRDHSVQESANGSAGKFPVGGHVMKFLLVIACMQFLFKLL